jgi:hypothetical protein
MRFDRSLFVAIASAAVFASACDKGDNANTSAANTPNTPPAAAAPAPASAADTSKPAVVLTGCLQEKTGMLGDYILTQAKPVMSSGPAIGTTGAADEKNSKGEAKGIEQRQLAQAERSYRLSGESDQLKGNVGHEIRVRGTLTDRGDVAKSDSDVSQSDLAKVDVTSVESIAPSCNAGSPKQ